MSNRNSSFMGSPTGSANVAGAVATFLLSVGTVLLPLLAIWFAWVRNALNGSLTTFGWTSTANGGVQLTSELKWLVYPVGCLLALNIARFFTVLFTSLFTESKADALSPPDTASNAIEVASGWILKFYGATYALWLLIASKGPSSKYWPVAMVLAVAAISLAIVKINLMYGFNKGRSQVRVKAAAVQHADAPAEVARSRKAKVTFRDVQGNSEIKARLLSAGKAITARRGQGEKPRNGILMGGDPGNGKTLLAEALAGELDLPFLSLTHSDVASQWVGERTVKIKAAFDQAIRNQPCMLFIDEIDSFLAARDDSPTSNKEDRDVVNSLLTLLVDVREHRVVIAAASNFVDRLDGASIREGRFDFKVEITPPDFEARVGLLRSGLAKHAHGLKVADGVLESVAGRWNGFSVKRILAVTEEMPSYLDFVRADSAKLVELQFDDFTAALRRIQGQQGVKPENVKSLEEMVFPDSTRQELNLAVRRLKDPVKFEKLGGTLPTGLLFVGPPGTGKTATAKALAKEVGWTFLISTGADLARDPKELEKLYRKAQELRPALIFVDEADELIRSREYSPSTASTNKLLTLMEGVNDRVTDVLWVAATNNPDQIDSALLRGGRFTEKVGFELPEQSAMLTHLESWLVKRKVKLAPGVSMVRVTDLMGNQSIANGEAILQHAVNRAIGHAIDDVVLVSMEDVRNGMSTVMGR